MPWGPFLFDAKISAGDAIQTVALLFAVAQFTIQSRANRRADAEAAALREETARKALESRQVEIYQRLEIESNAVFKFEAEHSDILPFFKTHLAPGRAEYERRAREGDDFLTARKYYENCCNLFEISARLRQKDIVDPEVFASWVAWYFDTLLEWGFRALWHDLRDNYTPQLRMVFDKFVNELIRDWDAPHDSRRGAGQNESEEAVRMVADQTIEALRSRFYAELGSKFVCPTITNWLARVEEGRGDRAHPLAFR
ncbi:hypothetical protein [Stakelama marina]|uniref:Uncharacterized protein n=1 Tax=Stakelama marina TaxID=2826939 RepID=A0A8T4IFF2_9SPHN|nr:hypothetical protein [Stakelama marina]MBR0553283.1 hypothetical protein [Stakelama marina]